MLGPPDMGNVATIDIFTSGDMALIVECEGKLVEMKKNEKRDPKTKPDNK